MWLVPCVTVRLFGKLQMKVKLSRWKARAFLGSVGEQWSASNLNWWHGIIWWRRLCVTHLHCILKGTLWPADSSLQFDYRKREMFTITGSNMNLLDSIGSLRIRTEKTRIFPWLGGPTSFTPPFPSSMKLDNEKALLVIFSVSSPHLPSILTQCNNINGSWSRTAASRGSCRPFFLASSNLPALSDPQLRPQQLFGPAATSHSSLLAVGAVVMLQVQAADGLHR